VGLGRPAVVGQRCQLGVDADQVVRARSSAVDAGIAAGDSAGLINGVDGNIVGVANPGLAPLGLYGGTSLTMPLLPGSPAINAGTSTGALATDQRGLARFGPTDIGAFESQGFTLTLAPGSTPQSAKIGTAFANPLAFSVTANNPVEPVDGAVVHSCVAAVLTGGGPLEGLDDWGAHRAVADRRTEGNQQRGGWPRGRHGAGRRIDFLDANPDLLAAAIAEEPP